mgnify:CR=1 FL=1
MQLPLTRDARARVMRFCRELMKLPQADVPTFHFFAPGVYVRQIRPVAGTAITGYIHMGSLRHVSAGGKDCHDLRRRDSNGGKRLSPKNAHQGR